MRRAIVIGLGVIALAGCQKKDEAAKTGEGQAASAAAPPAMPTRKAGLWSQTIATGGSTQTMKMCQDAATAEQMQVSNQGPSQSNCAKNTITPVPGGFRFESECASGDGGKVVSTGTATGDFSSSYSVKVSSVTTGSSMPQANGTHEVQIDAKWEGPCPANMKPGDMQLPNGMTINPAAMAGKMSGMPTKP